jgi:hypothetical protein
MPRVITRKIARNIMRNEQGNNRIREKWNIFQCNRFIEAVKKRRINFKDIPGHIQRDIKARLAKKDKQGV